MLDFYSKNLYIGKKKSQFFWKIVNPPPNTMCVHSCFSGVRLFATQWTLSLQAPLSIGYLESHTFNYIAGPVMSVGFAETWRCVSVLWEAWCVSASHVIVWDCSCGIINYFT